MTTAHTTTMFSKSEIRRCLHHAPHLRSDSPAAPAASTREKPRASSNQLAAPVDAQLAMARTPCRVDRTFEYDSPRAIWEPATASDLYEHLDFCLAETMGHKQMQYASTLIPIFKRMRHRCVIEEKALNSGNAARKEDDATSTVSGPSLTILTTRARFRNTVRHRFAYPKNVAKHESRRCTERKPRSNPPPTIRCTCSHRRCMKHA